MTNDEAILVTAFTGTLCCKFSDFHEFAEKRLGRPIWTHEMGDPGFFSEIKAAVRDDFLAMCKKAQDTRPAATTAGDQGARPTDAGKAPGGDIPRSPESTC